MGSAQSRRPRVQRESPAQGTLKLTELLDKHAARPKKGFGQHFLISQGVIDTIVSAAAEAKGILEVGPGPGVLTGPMTVGRPVIAVEVDRAILPVLAETSPAAEVVAGDALEIDLASLLRRLPEPRAVVSNMPYNITGPLLARFASLRELYAFAVLMMQREVAEKILAAPGSSGRGALSVAIQAQFIVSKVCNVPPGAFLPPPKVASTVLQLVPKPPSATIDKTLSVVSAGFRQPRKTLANNLVPLFGREDAGRRIQEAGLRPDVRPHQLTWEEWTTVAN